MVKIGSKKECKVKRKFHQSQGNVKVEFAQILGRAVHQGKIYLIRTCNC